MKNEDNIDWMCWDVVTMGVEAFKTALKDTEGQRTGEVNEDLERLVCDLNLAILPLANYYSEDDDQIDLEHIARLN